MIRDFVIILDVGNENVFWILIKGGAECEQQIFSKKLVSGSSEIQDIDVYVFDTEYLTAAADPGEYISVTTLGYDKNRHFQKEI